MSVLSVWNLCNTPLLFAVLIWHGKSWDGLVGVCGVGSCVVCGCDGQGRTSPVCQYTYYDTGVVQNVDWHTGNTHLKRHCLGCQLADNLTSSHQWDDEPPILLDFIQILGSNNRRKPRHGVLCPCLFVFECLFILDNILRSCKIWQCIRSPLDYYLSHAWQCELWINIPWSAVCKGISRDRSCSW